MKQTQYRLFDSLRRVQDFLNAHADVLGNLRDSEGAKQLDAAVAAAAAHRDSQGGSKRTRAGQYSQQSALSEQLIQARMAPIAKFARARLKGVAEFAALTQPVSISKKHALVDAGRSMVTAAARHEVALLEGGFPADTIAQLSAAVEALREAMAERESTRVESSGATKGIERELERGREGVKMLGAVIAMQFASDEPFLAAWRSASRVTAKPGSVRGSSVVAVVPPVKTSNVEPAPASVAQSPSRKAA